MTRNIKTGNVVFIPIGQLVIRKGEKKRQQRETLVTVRKVEMTKSGDFKITWHADGNATTIIKKDS